MQTAAIKFTDNPSVGALLHSADASGNAEWRSALFVDALFEYGGGTVFSDATIIAALTAIGTTNKALLFLRPGSWTFSQSRDWTSYTNVFFVMPNGALLVNGAYNLGLYNPPVAGPYQLFSSGVGVVSITGYPQERKWWNETQRLDVVDLKVGADLASEKFAAVEANKGDIDNFSFTVVKGSKALTFTILDGNGDAPSALTKVSAKMRSATLTDSKLVRRYVEAPSSIVLSSGSTLGYTASEYGRIYFGWVDSDGAGTMKPCIARKATAFNEGGLVTTVAEGGAGAADSANVLYSDAAYTDKPAKVLGYAEIQTGAVPGEWDNDATKIQVMGYGVDKRINSDKGTAPLFACRAWLRYNGSSSTILGSENITSVTKTGTGAYKIALAVDMADANFCTIGTASDTNFLCINAMSASEIAVQVRRHDNVAVDSACVCVAIFE